jgi:hypothetical protein
MGSMLEWLMGMDCKSIGKRLHRFKSYSAQEKNAILDKSKKSVVNITYELDNLLVKMKKVIETSNKFNMDSIRCFDLIYQQLTGNYFENKFQIILKSLKDLKFCTNALIFDFFKKELLKKAGADNVIDVDLAEDS